MDNQHQTLPEEPEAPASPASGEVAPVNAGVAAANSEVPVANSDVPVDNAGVPVGTPNVPVATPKIMDAPATDGNDAEREMKRISRRSFLWAGAATIAGLGGLRWLDTRRLDSGIVWPLRRTLEADDEVARDLFSTGRLAPQWEQKRAREVRVNGDVGVGDGFDPSTWKLKVTGLANDDAHLTLAEIQKLPHTAFTTEFKCIEGWATIVSWSGVKLSDFMAHYAPQTQSGNEYNPQHPDDLPEYVGLSTPDKAYYVGIEREVALHPQTILCFEMNGKPLTLDHGAPLRLVVPVKYGVKHIKRIGTLSFSNTKPADYWAEQGYAWGDGH